MKNDYEIRGNVTAVYIRYKGRLLETIVDTEDLPLLLNSEFSWYAKYAKSNKSLYVVGYGIKRNGKQKHIFLHRLLMGDPKGKLVDHINNNTLDNRRSNLRLATVSQNLQNRKGVTIHNTSGYRGVSFDKECGKYRAYIRINNKLIHLGRFDTAVEAARAASAARKKYMPYSKEARKLEG